MLATVERSAVDAAPDAGQASVAGADATHAHIGGALSRIPSGRPQLNAERAPEYETYDEAMAAVDLLAFGVGQGAPGRAEHAHAARADGEERPQEGFIHDVSVISRAPDAEPAVALSRAWASAGAASIMLSPGASAITPHSTHMMRSPHSDLTAVSHASGLDAADSHASYESVRTSTGHRAA